MLEKKVSYDHSITERGVIQIRRITRVFEDDVLLGEKYHRHCISPGEDSKNEDDRTKKIVTAIHTPEIISEYEKSLEKIV